MIAVAGPRGPGAGRRSAALVDRYLVDGAVNGISALTLAGGRRLQRVQTGRINHYVLGIALGAGLLVALTWVFE